MVTIVKHEWHQHDRQYAIELDEALLSEIYPELDDAEIAEKLRQVEEGDISVDDIISDAYDNDVEIEWDFQYDDCWTDRKGGYDVTYELGDEFSWVEPTKEPEPTHKCTKCRWTGQGYNTLTQYLREDGSVIEDYFNSEEESQNTKDVCPMCDSDIELTAEGVIKEEENKKMMAELDDMFEDESDSEIQAGLNETLGLDRDATLEDLVDRIAELDEAPKYPAGVYTLRIWGRTREIGVSKIKKAQYEYWSHEDHEDDLSDALNENYDYDDNDTPKAARFDLPYYEYQDKISFWGFDEDDTHVTITNSDEEEIFEGDMGEFEGEEVEELYPEYLGKGYWLVWTQSGKGSCLQVTIDTGDEEFDPEKLTYTTWDVNGSTVINRVLYDGVELDDEGMDSEHDNWRGQWSQFDVYHNEK